MDIRKVAPLNFGRLFSTAFTTLILLSQVTWAAATFGAEFNFSNSALRQGQEDGFTVNSDASEAARDKMKRLVLKKCQNCRAEAFVNGYGVKNYQIVYPDGWYFVIATDPIVVEIQTRPSTVQEIEKHSSRIQSDIFETAKAVGLLPSTQSVSKNWAGSHIHVGVLSALGKGPDAVKKFRNFLVDFANHSELANGIFTLDRLNAPALAALPIEQQDQFAKIIEDVDADRIKSIATLAKRIRNEVYNVTLHADLDPTSKYHALNVNRIGNKDFHSSEQTFEIRAMRGQESAEDFLIQTRLIQARLDFLERNRKLVDFSPLSVLSTDFAKTESFYRYVTETGLDFEPYKRFLSPFQMTQLTRIKEIINLEKDRAYQDIMATSGSCRRILQ